MAAAQAGGDSPIPVHPHPQLTVPTSATPKPRGVRRRGSAQWLPEPGESPVSPPSHSLPAPWGPEHFSDVLPARGGHLPPQGRIPRGCRHRDDTAHEGRRCPVMPAPRKLMPQGLHQAPAAPHFSLICFSKDCEEGADGQDISKPAGTNDLHQEPRNSWPRGISQSGDVYLTCPGTLWAAPVAQEPDEPGGWCKAELKEQRSRRKGASELKGGAQPSRHDGSECWGRGDVSCFCAPLPRLPPDLGWRQVPPFLDQPR